MSRRLLWIAATLLGLSVLGTARGAVVPDAPAPPAPPSPPAGPGAESTPAPPVPPVPPVPPLPPPPPHHRRPPATKGSGRWESQPSAAQAMPGACLAFRGDRSLVRQALRELTIAVGDESRAISDVRLSGLTTLEEGPLWEMLGGKPGPAPAIPPPGGAYEPAGGASRPPARWTAEQVTAVVTRLAGSGLFAHVAPTLRIDGAGAVVEVKLDEHPSLRKVVISGLGESAPSEILGIMLEAPSQEEVERSRRGPAGDDAREPEDDDGDAGALEPRCAQPLPAPDWLARSGDDGVLRPGIVWKGLRPAVARVMEHLYDEGYQMASISAVLGPDGTLTLAVDEGHIASVEVRGVHPNLERRVLDILGLHAGRVFLRPEADAGVSRVEQEFPFLRGDVANHPTRAAPRIVETIGEGGSRSYRTVDRTAARAADDAQPGAAGQDAGEDSGDDESGDEPDDDDDDGAAASARALRAVVHARVRGILRGHAGVTQVAVASGHVIVFFRTQRTDQDGSAAELLRHTPVTSFGPGFEVTNRFWDPADRIHVALDGAVNLNLGRGHRAVPDGTLSGAAAQQRFDWKAGARVQLPALKIAELGADFHGFTDTSDRWRIWRGDSYIYSMLFNRPQSEYYRRTGASAFATAHLFDRLTAGVEYRFDRYDSMHELRDVPTLFNRDEPTWHNPDIDDGLMGSVLLRAEYATERAPASMVGTWRRWSETSLVRRKPGALSKAALHTIATVEIADPALGGDFHFARLVSDTGSYLPLGDHQGVRLRLRAAGAVGDGVLPRQKEEALGGWTGLRGYDFKELRGNFSVLGTLEYQIGELAGFADLGTVDQGIAGWSPAKLGLGVAIHADDGVDLAVAWRTDERARALPEFRILFQRAF